MLDRLRKRISDVFTEVVVVDGEKFEEMRGRSQTHVRLLRRGRKPQEVAVTPSERFVWCITALIICLVSVVVLEGVYIVVTGKLSTELLTVISGLTGSLTTAFWMGNKK